MAEFEVHGVQFAEQGLVIQYMEVPTDVRVQGRAIKTHTLQLHAGHPDYAEDMEDLHRKVVKVLKNALEDFEDSEPYIPEEETADDDEDRGMGE